MWEGEEKKYISRNIKIKSKIASLGEQLASIPLGLRKKATHPPQRFGWCRPKLALASDPSRVSWDLNDGIVQLNVHLFRSRPAWLTVRGQSCAFFFECSFHAVATRLKHVPVQIAIGLECLSLQLCEIPVLHVNDNFVHCLPVYHIALA